MTREEAIKHFKEQLDIFGGEHAEAIKVAIEALEAVPQSEQYKKGFEDAKRAFLVEYARESENIRKRNAQLEVMLNAQKAISADRPRGEWIAEEEYGDFWVCDQCGFASEHNYSFCPICGTMMTGGEDE